MSASGAMVTIVVDGRDVRVPTGVSVAAAMLSAGVGAFRESVNGSVRGPLCGMGVCYECRVMIDDVAHRRACLVMVADGLRVSTHDELVLRSARDDKVVRRTIHEERVLRSAQDDRYDVVVIGAGPAGIAAATRAAECGRRVLLLDEGADVGGQIWRHRAGVAARGAARAWVERLTRSRVTVLCGASVVDVVRRAQGGFALRGERAAGALLVEADMIVLATGARERFLPFPGWTLPGVIGVGAAQALLKSGTSFSGKRVVMAGSGPLLLPVASALTADGAVVRLVAEQATALDVARYAAGLVRHPATLVQAARYRIGFAAAPYTLGTWVSAARGDGRVEEVDVTDGRTLRTLACDVLCAAFGLVPNTELARLLGCEVAAGLVVVDPHQQTRQHGVYCAGEPTGIGGVELSLVEGEIAGLSSAGRHAEARTLHPRREMLRRDAATMGRAFALRPALASLATADTIVCRCEDVTHGAISTCRTMRQAKLYTRAGMGACQGRICGAALEFLHGWEPDTMRLPSEPTLYSTLTASPATSAPAANHGA